MREESRVSLAHLASRYIQINILQYHSVVKEKTALFLIFEAEQGVRTQGETIYMGSGFSKNYSVSAQGLPGPTGAPGEPGKPGDQVRIT